MSPCLVHCTVNIVQYRCGTVQYCTVLYNTGAVPNIIVQYCTLQVQFSTVQWEYSTVQYSTVQYSTVNIVQYSTVQYSKYSTVQYRPYITGAVRYCIGWSHRKSPNMKAILKLLHLTKKCLPMCFFYFTMNFGNYDKNLHTMIRTMCFAVWCLDKI